MKQVHQKQGRFILAAGLICAASLFLGSPARSEISVSRVGIVAGGVTTAKLADGAVTTPKINQDAVTEEKILDLNVTERKLAAGAVTTAKLADGAVTSEKIHSEALLPLFLDKADKMVGINDFDPSNELSIRNPDANTVGIHLTASDTGASGTDGMTISLSASEGFINLREAADLNFFVNGSERMEIDQNGVVTIPGSLIVTTALTMPDGTVTTAKLGDGAVTSAKLGTNSVRDFHINSGAVTTAKIGDGAVTTSKLGPGIFEELQSVADGAITTAKLAAGAVTSSKLSPDAVTTLSLLNLNVTEAKIAAGAVTTPKLGTDSVSGVKILNNTITDEKLASTFLKNVVEDTTPQLGGTLDTQENWISGDSDAEGIKLDTSGNVGMSANLTVDSSGTITGDMLVDGQLGVAGTSSFYSSMTLFGDMNISSSTIVIDGSGSAVHVFLTDGETTDWQAQTGNAPMAIVSDNAVGHFANVQTGNSNSGAGWYFMKTRDATALADTIVNDNDRIAEFLFLGADGALFKQAAVIRVSIDGAPGLSDMPGRIQFLTTPDGSSVVLERMRIDNAGDVGIGETAPAAKLEVKPLEANLFSLQISSQDGAARMVVDRLGNVGIGITPDGGNLHIMALDDVESAIKISSSNGTTVMFRVDRNGHVEFSGTDPTLGTCANGAVDTLSSDSVMIVDFSGNNSTCAIVFAHVWGATPVCQCTAKDAGNNSCEILADSTTGVTVGPVSGNWASGDDIHILCFGMHAE